MSLRTQKAPFVLTGSTIADLPNPATIPEGYIFRAHTGEALVLEIDPATQVHSWQVLEASAASSTLPKYWVNNSPAAPGEIPVALYSDIQAAIDAAFADGHGPANPAVVIPLPGAYSQAGGAALTLRAGIDVVGFGGSNGNSSDVTFTGNVVASFADGTAMQFSGIAVTGQLQISGAGHFTLVVKDSVFAPSTGDAINYTNSAGAAVVLTNSQFISLGGNGRGAAGINNAITATDSSFTPNGSGDAFAFGWHSSQNFLRCIFNGRVNGSGTNAGTAKFTDCTFNPTSTDVMHLAPGATAQIRGGMITGTPTDAMFSSNGGPNSVLQLINVESVGTHISIQSTNIDTLPSYEMHIYSENNIGGATPYTISANALADLNNVIQTGGWVLLLPSLTGVATGLRITFSNLNATAGAVTLTPSGTDTVNGQAPGASYISGAPARAVTLQVRANAGTFDWRIVSISPL